MKLPNFEKAIIPREKITDYLLSSSHRDGRGKAAFFALFGFTSQSWQILAGALLQHAAEHEVAKIEETPFGTRYVIEGELMAPVGRAPIVRVVWFIELGAELPRLATAYPQRKE
jgi:hypothetical protein